MQAFRLATRWPVDNVALVAVTPTGTFRSAPADDAQRFRLASLTKPMAAWATLIAVEEGIVELDRRLDAARDRVPDGVTLRHLLAHAGGFGFDGEAPVAAPERKRIYSNTGFERLADVVARAAEMPFAQYLTEAVFLPLGMERTELIGSAAHGVHSPIFDVERFVAELMQPTLITSATRDEAVRPQYLDLAGIVPGVGRFTPCPWGLGFELHGSKAPHWMGHTNSPATYGHFGGAGTMMWVDPVADVGLAALTDRPFDEWATDALRLWPELSDAVLAEVAVG